MQIGFEKISKRRPETIVLVALQVQTSLQYWRYDIERWDDRSKK